MVTERLSKIAQDIVNVLYNCSFNNITQGSGYFVIKKIDDELDRCVDVTKWKKDDGTCYYAVYCLYEDDEGEWRYTKTLSVDELTKILEEFYFDEIVW